MCLHFLQPLRDDTDNIVDVLSAKRSKALNDAVGGEEYSDHLFRGFYSCAADIFPHAIGILVGVAGLIAKEIFRTFRYRHHLKNNNNHQKEIKETLDTIKTESGTISKDLVSTGLRAFWT